MLDLLIDVFVEICLSPIGYIYVRLRYGKQYKDLLEKNYDGCYSTAASVNIFKSIGLAFTIVLGIIALIAILNLVLSGIKHIVK